MDGPHVAKLATGEAAALTDRKAVSVLPDHAFGFELPDVGPPAIKVLR